VCGQRSLRACLDASAMGCRVYITVGRALLPCNAGTRASGMMPSACDQPFFLPLSPWPPAIQLDVEYRGRGRSSLAQSAGVAERERGRRSGGCCTTLKRTRLETMGELVPALVSSITYQYTLTREVGNPQRHKDTLLRAERQPGSELGVELFGAPATCARACVPDYP
jgi:hypothetical protein